MFYKANFRQRLISLLCLLMASIVAGVAYAQDNLTYTLISGTAGYNANEAPEKALDGKTSTKWCSGNRLEGWELVFQTSRPVRIAGYSITTANDTGNTGCSGRNPQSWVLYGSNDAGNDKTWTVIDQVDEDNVLQQRNLTRYDFACGESAVYSYFKWSVSKNEGGTCLQISELALILPDCEHLADGKSTWEKTGTIAPTCTETGYNVYVCSHCCREKYESDGRPALGHTTVLHPANDELSCVTPLHDDYYECTRCGKNYHDAAGEQEIVGSLYTYVPLETTLESESTSTSNRPFNASYRNSTTLVYYSADEVGAVGHITGLQFKVAEGSSTLDNNKLKIYLATVPAGSKERPAIEDLTLVYENEKVSVGGSTPGWQPWKFNVSDYNYDGSGDLLVVVCRQNIFLSSSVKYLYTTTSNHVFYRNSDSDSSYGIYDPSVYYSQDSFFPFTKFNVGVSSHKLELHHDYDCINGGHEDWYECLVCHQLKSSNTPTTNDDIINAPIERAIIGQHTDMNKDEFCDVCGTFYHALVHHAATTHELTCAHPTNAEHWNCLTCGKNFTDAAGEHEYEGIPYTYVSFETTLESESTSTSNRPFSTGDHNSTTLVYYTADEVGTVGQISGLQFKVAEGSSTLSNNKLKIYLATVPAGSKQRPAIEDLTLVYENEKVSVGGSTPGWQPWEFNVSNYNYDGSGDLLVVVCRQNTSWSSSVKYLYTNTSNRVFYRSQDNDSSYGVYDPSVSYSENSSFPFTKFNVDLSSHNLKLHHDYDCLDGGYQDWYECLACHQLKSSNTPTTDADIITDPIERRPTGQHFDEDGDMYCDDCGHVAVSVDGTYKGQFVIATPDDLKTFATRVNGGETSLSAVLLNDIDMTGVTDYVPAAYATSFDNTGNKTPADATIPQPGYTGTFDGHGHVIKNLTIASDIVTDGLCSVGIFGNLSGTVKNLGVEKFYFKNTTGKDGRFGVISGVMLPGALVTDCYVTNSTLSDSKQILGVFAGGGYGGEVRNCYVWNNSISANTRCGHVIGDLRNDVAENPLSTRIVNVYTNVSRNVNSYRYYVADHDGTQYAIMSRRMNSGEICYRLAAGRSADAHPWRQTLAGEDKNDLPVFASAKADEVYYGYTEEHPCDAPVYSNASLAATPVHQLEHQAALAEGTCIAPAHPELWECTVCHAAFHDAAATQPMKLIDRHADTHSTFDVTYESLNVASYSYPMLTGYKYGIFATLYTPAQVGATGDLTAIAYKHSSEATMEDCDISIYLTENSNTNYFNTSSNAVSTDDAVLVYEGHGITLGADKDAEGWQTFTFNRERYHYSGEKSLIVIVRRHSPAASSNVKFSCVNNDTGPYYSVMRSTDAVPEYLDGALNGSNSNSRCQPFARFSVLPDGSHNLQQHVDYDCVEGGHEDWYECVACQVLKSTNTPATDEDVITQPVSKAATGAHADENADGICDVCHALIDLTQDTAGNYVIATPANLKKFSEMVNGGLTNINGVLACDIDMRGVEGYKPIAYATSFDNLSSNKAEITQPGYTGTFDGCGHEIKNLTIDSSLSAECFSIGVFGNVSGTVRHLGVRNIVYDDKVTNSSERFGGIAGVVLTGGLVTDCYVYLATLKDSESVGGVLVGATYGGTVSNCYCYCYSYSTSFSSRSAGIVGDLRNDDGSLQGSVVNCFTSLSENISSSVYKTSGATRVTYGVSTAMFKSGAVCYSLNEGAMGDDVVWRQTIEGNSTDTYPGFNPASAIVYGGYTEEDPCQTMVYGNTQPLYLAPQHVMTHTAEQGGADCLNPAHNEYWHCSRCDRYYADAAGMVLTTPAERATTPYPLTGSYEPTEDTTAGKSLFTSYYRHGTTLVLYHPDEVGVAGPLTQIAFAIDTRADYGDNGIRIYMCHTDLDEFDATRIFHEEAPTLVYEGTGVTLGRGVDDWEVFDLNGDFCYDGTRNLVVIICRTNTYYNSDLKYKEKDVDQRRMLYKNSDSHDSYAVYQSGEALSYSSTHLPFARFTRSIAGHALAFKGGYDCLEGGAHDYYECVHCHMLKSTLTPMTDGDAISVAPLRPAMGHVDANADHRCDECGTYLIATAADLKAFADAVNGGEYGLCAAVTADIDATSYGYTDLRIGTSAHPYTGTFDGLYHTLNYNFTATESDAALFRYVNNATFKNLHVTGSISSNSQFAAGLVSYASGATKFSNIWSSVDIATSYNGDATCGGILARNNTAKSSTHCTLLENCLYDGKFTGKGYRNSGIVAWLHDESQGRIVNCLVVGEYEAGTNGAQAITRNGSNNCVTITNSYYLNAYSSTNNGTQTNAAALADGTILAALNDEGNTWYQVCKGDDAMAYPVPWMFGVYDTNGNGIISIADVSTYVGNLTDGTPVYDVNADGNIDTQDVTTLANKVLKK